MASSASLCSKLNCSAQLGPQRCRVQALSLKRWQQEDLGLRIVSEANVTVAAEGQAVQWSQADMHGRGAPCAPPDPHTRLCAAGRTG